MDIVPFNLGIVIQEIEILFPVIPFVDCLYYNVTELLWRKNCRMVYSGKVVYWKDASEEGECWTKIWIVPFVVWETMIGNECSDF